MTEHKALSAFEQAKLQEEVEALNLRVARMTEALDLLAGTKKEKRNEIHNAK